MTYQVNAQRSPRGWSLVIDGVADLECLSLSHADRMLRDYLATRDGVSPEAVQYEITPPIAGHRMEDLLQYAATVTHSALITLRRSGRAQVSTVRHRISKDGTLIIAASVGRAKVVNLRRDPRATVYIARDHDSYVTIDGRAEISQPVRAADDEIATRFAEHYRALRGEELTSAFREQLVAEGRRLIEITPTAGRGMSV